MKTYSPDYYNQFECIKEKCRYSCCIGWEIDIDQNTLSYYENTKGEFGYRLKKAISYDGAPHFVMGDNNRCPFLNSSNLCDIYINLGKEHLCEICTLHPRFINQFDTRREIGIGLCCEAASRLILTKIDKTIMLPEDEKEEEILLIRDEILKKVQNRTEDFQTLFKAFLTEYGIVFPEYTFDEWKDVLLGLEILNPKWEQILNEAKEMADYTWMENSEYRIALEQLFSYFVIRYINKENEENIKGWLSFCAFSVYMIINLFSACDNKTMDELIVLCVLYSSEIEYSQDNVAELMMELI